MTIEELRERKKQLLAMKAEEEALQAEGKGDNLNYFIIKEELLDVNAHLREMLPKKRLSMGKRTTNPDFQFDRQQFLNWQDQEDHGDNDEKAFKEQAAKKALSFLSQNQREIFLERSKGRKLEDIAAERGLDKSTVCRTNWRAKRNLQLMVNAMMTKRELLTDGNVVDLRDPKTQEGILGALTSRQIMYLYLYYSEYLSLREIEEIVGVDRSSIMRTIRRALYSLGNIFGGENIILDNVDVLDEIACTAFYSIQDQLDLSEEHKIPRIRTKEYHLNRVDICTLKKPPIQVRSPSGGLVDTQSLRIGLNTALLKSRGKLLQLLLDRRRRLVSDSTTPQKNLLRRWLEKIFSTFTKERGLSWRRNRMYNSGVHPK